MDHIRYHSASGRVGRVLAARILPGEDLVSVIIELVKDNGFRSGTASAIGSIFGASLIGPGPMWTVGNADGGPSSHVMEGPLEMGFAYGIFGTDDDNTINMHLHGLLMDGDGKARFGNLVEGSTKILATVEIIIYEMEGMEFIPTLDKTYNHKFLHPTMK